MYCFSPPVMMATFIIEIGLLIWVLAKWGAKSSLNRLVLAVLFFLAVFQLAEYNVCGRFNIDALTWSRIGFVSITMLPPLGLHMVHVLAGKKQRALTCLSYATGAVFIYIFAFSAAAFESHVCAGNYAIFQLNAASHVGGLYFVYYYGWLLVTMALAAYFARRLSKSGKKSLWYLIAGYCFFMVPTTIVNMVNPETMTGIPSIMCGFAVTWALVTVFGILPANAEHAASKNKRKKKRKK